MNKQTKIGILGGGVEGLAAAQYFLEHGYKEVTIFDEKSAAEKNLSKNLQAGANFYGGSDYLEKARGCDMLLRSPGIHMQKVREALPDQVQKQIKLTSTTQYFMEHCPCKIIGVTGTKGKGTTSTLITLVVKEAGYDVYVGGNIGQSPFEFLDKLTADSIVVLEMSSFQLQDLTVSPHIAVMLRVSSDHLDYHQDIQEYWKAKSSILRYQKPSDMAIINADYHSFDYYSQFVQGHKLAVSTRTKVDEGAFLDGEKIMFVHAGKKEMMLATQEVGLIGRHNLENVLPAICVGKIMDILSSTIQKVVRSFKGLPHRLALAGEIKGVKYYNDSFSTTPETSIAGVESFTNPVILIAGGSEKYADYTEWAIALQQAKNLQSVLLIGQTAGRMEEVLQAQKSQRKHGGLQIHQCKNLEDALQDAHQKATAGDIVLMSPAAASFGLFKNYKERGEKFCEIVKHLASQ